MIYGETGYSSEFGREVVNDRCEELPVKPLVNADMLFLVHNGAPFGKCGANNHNLP
jgi:hypothetical protein